MTLVLVLAAGCGRRAAIGRAWIGKRDRRFAERDQKDSRAAILLLRTGETLRLSRRYRDRIAARLSF